MKNDRGAVVQIGLLGRVRRFFNSRRNRIDLYHVTVPLALAMSMSPTNIGGALLFLIIWWLVRWLFHV